MSAGPCPGSARTEAFLMAWRGCGGKCLHGIGSLICLSFRQGCQIGSQKSDAFLKGILYRRQNRVTGTNICRHGNARDIVCVRGVSRRDKGERNIQLFGSKTLEFSVIAGNPDFQLKGSMDEHHHKL